MRKKFAGQLNTLTIQGTDYVNQQRLKPLTGAGKPLWEFKEHDHRLYCFRKQGPAKTIQVVLLSGWAKQKTGRSSKEDREVERAIGLYNEFMNEYPGGEI